MSILSQNISAYRQRRQWSQKELADKLGVRVSTISNYETGYSAPKQSILLHLSDLFGVSVDTLLGHSVREETHAEPPFQVIPIVGKITSSSPVFPQEHILGSLYLPQETARRQDYFAWVVADNSMDLCRVRAGDLLLIRRQTTFESGDLVLSLTGGIPQVRRYIEEPTRTLLRPESSSSAYLPIPADEAVILGKVTRGIITF